MSYIADLGAGADEAFQPLEWMRSLTHLSLNCCSLRSMPPQVRFAAVSSSFCIQRAAAQPIPNAGPLSCDY